MVEPLRKRLLRLVGFIEQLKRDRYPNVQSYARYLEGQDRLHGTDTAASARTIKRDIAYLRDVLGAPIDYDASNGGYELVDKSWSFPLQSLGGAEVFPNVLVGGASALHPVYREAMYTPVSLINPTEMQIQELVPLILATHGTPSLEPEVVEAILYAWKDRRVARVSHLSPRTSTTERDIEVHAVFVQEGIWYARAWCRLRQELRIFALHRIRHARLLDATFEHRAEVTAGLEAGNVLGYEMAENIVVRCAARHAGFYAEREWFAGQYDRHAPDGSLEMVFPRAPRPVIVAWVLYNAPELELIEPEALRHEVAAKAHRMAAIHDRQLAMA